MKKIFLSLILLCALSAGASAQSWKDLLGKAASELAEEASSTAAGSVVTNILGEILGNSLTLSYEALEGTWNYEGVACVLESEDALSNIGGTLVTGTLESKLDEKLALVGVSKGNCSFTFAKDSTCVINVSGYNLNGKYELNVEDKVIVFTFMYDKLPVKTYVSYEIQTVNIVFKADRLLSFIKNVASYVSSDNGISGEQLGQLQTAMQAIGAMGTLLENYDGMMLGAKLSKADAESATAASSTSNAATATEATTTSGNANESTGSKVIKGLGGLLKK